MAISKFDKEGLFLGCAPIVSTLTGIIKLKDSVENHKILKKAQSNSDLGNLSGIIYERFKHIESFDLKKKKLNKAYRIEQFFNFIETIPVIGNVIMLFRTIHIFKTINSSKKVASPNPENTQLPLNSLQSPITKSEAIKRNSVESSSDSTEDLSSESESVSEIKETALKVSTDKNYVPSESKFCAFKNALSSIGLFAQAQDGEAQYHSTTFYQMIKSFVSKFKSIPSEAKQLGEALEYLLLEQSSNKNENKHSKELSQYAGYLKIPGIFVSVLDNDISEKFACSSQNPLSLNSLASLNQFLDYGEFPKMQIFMYRDQGIWNVATLQQDGPDDKEWIIFNSEQFEKESIDLHVMRLEKILQNLSQPEFRQKFNYKQFDRVVGKEIQTLSNYLTSEGKLNPSFGDQGKFFTEGFRPTDKSINYFKDLYQRANAFFQGMNENNFEDFDTYEEEMARLDLFLSNKPIEPVVKQPPPPKKFFPVQLTSDLVEGFLGGKGTGLVKYAVSEGRLYYKNCLENEEDQTPFDKINNKPIWRSFITMFSSIPSVSTTAEALYTTYYDEKQIIESYEKVTGTQTTPETKELLAQVAPCKNEGAGHLFIANLYLAENTIRSELISYNFQFGKKENKILQTKKITEFSKLAQLIEDHFKRYSSSIIVDNGKYSFVILGIKIYEEQIQLLFADSQAASENEAMYAVIFNKKGEQIKTIKNFKSHYLHTLQKLRFTKNDKWFLLFPQANPLTLT